MLLTEIYDIYNDLDRPIVQVVTKGGYADIYVNFQTDQLKERMEEQTTEIIENVLNNNQVDDYRFINSTGNFSTFIRATYNTTRKLDHIIIKEQLINQIHQLYLSTKEEVK